MTHRIAMWSGPRNISTALMRSFEARGDCHVVDEPLYAAYLHKTGLKHPMYAEILASQPTDWASVIRTLDSPCSLPLQYEKHMSHHVLPEMDLGWLTSRTHVFLLRHPTEVIASYAKRHDEIRAEDLGILQQARLFDHVTEQAGKPPIVVHARDILDAPEPTLTELCHALRIPYTDRMLTWSPGLRPTDGVWASHWYERVASSSGFGSARPAPPTLPISLQNICDPLMPDYHRMRRHALRPKSS